MITDPRSTRPTREETRARILATADELFRQYGISKTTVADIASELGMSPANIYKFFPSKDAICEASAGKNFELIFQSVWQIVRGPGSSAERLESVVVTIFQFHNDLLRNERQIFRLITQAMEEEWSCMDRYETVISEVLTELVRQGSAAGEFRNADDPAMIQTLLDSLSVAFHPHLQFRWNRDESDARVRSQVRFLLRALR